MLPRPRTLARLAELLQVSVDDLLAGGSHDSAAFGIAETESHDVMDDVTINLKGAPADLPPEALEAIRTLLRPYFEGER